MKLLYFLAAFIPANNAISCFTCASDSTANCAADGAVQVCADNAQSCQITMRRRAGDVEQVIFEIWSKIEILVKNKNLGRKP